MKKVVSLFKKIFNFDFERILAEELSAELFRKLPAKGIQSGTNSKLTEKKVARAVEDLGQQAAQRSTGRRIGVLRRSVLANNLKWRLRDAGYHEEFVNMAVESLVFALATKKS